MSSYLNIYLVPKRKDKKEKKQYLLLTSYSKSCDIYQAFYENINPVFTGNESKYTTLTDVNIQEVIVDLNEAIKSYKERLELYNKYAKDNPDYIEEIIGTKELLQDYQSTYNIASSIKDIIEDTLNDYNDFEEVCCNIS